MSRKAVFFKVLFFILVIPTVLISEDLETTISADQITVQSDNMLKAYGNVFVKRGNVSIKADAMFVNEETNQIQFLDITEFSDGNSLKLSGKSAVLSSDLSSGIITATKILIDEKIRIHAEEINSRTLTERAEINRITSVRNAKVVFHYGFLQLVQR